MKERIPKTVKELEVKAEADDEWVRGEYILKDYNANDSSRRNTFSSSGQEA